MRNFLAALWRLPRVLTLSDKFILGVILLTVIATSGLWWQHVTKFWVVKPVKGGTYTEGIVNSDPYSVGLVSDKLTKIGLTYTDHTSKVHGALADRWEITNDGKTYTFYINKALKASEIADTYSSLPDWQNIDIKAGDNNTLIMNLKQPFAPLLSFTGEPVIQAGPYIKDKQTATEMTFSANKKFVLGEPNLQHIVFVYYPDERSLKAALQRQEIMGADAEFHGIPGTVTKKLELTKQTVMLFNMQRPVFNDKKIRQQIKDNQKLDKAQSVTLVTTQDPRLLEIANQFSDKAKKIGLTVSIKSVNEITLERDIVPSEDYDLFLTEFNYGYDQDPYPYWHSSQILGNGKNYAGYNNKDADKLIEDARQTLDDAERQKKYDQFQQILNQDVPAIFYPKQTFVYTMADRIKGVKQGTAVVPADRFTEVWQWFLKAKRQKK